MNRIHSYDKVYCNFLEHVFWVGISLLPSLEFCYDNCHVESFSSQSSIVFKYMRQLNHEIIKTIKPWDSPDVLISSNCLGLAAWAFILTS